MMPELTRMKYNMKMVHQVSEHNAIPVKNTACVT